MSELRRTTQAERDAYGEYDWTEVCPCGYTQAFYEAAADAVDGESPVPCVRCRCGTSEGNHHGYHEDNG